MNFPWMGIFVANALPISDAFSVVSDWWGTFDFFLSFPQYF
jgi:hypothetical protein